MFTAPTFAMIYHNSVVKDRIDMKVVLFSMRSYTSRFLYTCLPSARSMLRQRYKEAVIDTSAVYSSANAYVPMLQRLLIIY